MPLRPRRSVTVLVAALAPLSLIAWLARASAGDDAGAQARQVLTELEAQRSAAPPAPASAAPSTSASIAPVPTTSPVTAADDAIAEAKKALARAAELRTLGDIARAELAEDLALEWALTARETVAAVGAEREADVLGAKAIEATTKAARARSLLEEAIARRGKLQTVLDDLEKDAAQKALSSPSGAKPPKKPPAGPGPKKGGAK